MICCWVFRCFGRSLRHWKCFPQNKQTTGHSFWGLCDSKCFFMGCLVPKNLPHFSGQKNLPHDLTTSDIKSAIDFFTEVDFSLMCGSCHIRSVPIGVNLSKLMSNFGCLFTFCYSAWVNQIKTKLQACNLQTGQSISYKYVNQF